MKEITDSYIDAYLLGRLSEEEKVALEKSISEDQQLQARVTKTKVALDYIEAMNDQSVQKQIKQIGQDFKRKKVTQIRNIYRWSIAAAVILLVFFSAQYWLSPNNPDKLYQSYFTDYPLSTTTRDNQQAQLSKAYELYHQKNYSSALPLFQSSLNEQESAKARVGIAVCLLHLERQQEVLNILSPLIEKRDPLYYSQALWYSALAQLKSNNIPAAILLLNDISSDQYFYEKAASLLKELR